MYGFSDNYRSADPYPRQSRAMTQALDDADDLRAPLAGMRTQRMNPWYHHRRSIINQLSPRWLPNNSRSEAMFERAEKEFGDIDTGRGTIGKTAKAELYEIRNLGVGKPAPEITGEDIAGKPFKLSDYKGKVVVVDFWGDW